MIRRIAFKEIAETFREGRFKIASVLIFTLLLMAVLISRNYYSMIQTQHAAANANARNIWVSQDAKNPHDAAHYGTYAFKPKYPLSLIDQGVDKFAGISIYLEAHKRNEAEFMAAADQTGLARFGDLTPDFILLFILPLLIILMGYNTFTREQEGGTLKLVKSQGLSNWTLAVGKWWGIFLPMLLITTFLFAVGGVLLSTLSDFGSFEVTHLLLLFAVYLLFYAIFTNLTLVVSMLSKSSGIALVVLLAVWIIICLGAPKAASNLADTLHPYPTRQEFSSNIAEDKQKGLDGHNPWNKEAKLLETAVLKEYGVDSVQQLPFNFDAYRMQKGEEHEAEIYFKHYALLKQTYQQQSQMYKVAAAFSPFLPTRFLSMAIARTDYQAHWDFADAAEKYRISMQAALNDNFAKNSTYGDWDYQADKSLWSSIPDFSYTPISMGAVLERNSSNIIILFSWLLISFAGLWLAARKI